MSPSARTANGWRPAAQRTNDAQVWRLRDATQVADLAIESLGGLLFSPDERWLMTTHPPCRLWEVGTWSEARRSAAKVSASPPTAGYWWPRTRARSSAWSKPRPAGHWRTARKPRPVRGGICDLQPRRVAAGGDHRRWPSRARLGPESHPPAPRRDRPRLGSPGLFRCRLGRPHAAAASPLKVDYGPLSQAGQLDPRAYDPLIADLETALRAIPKSAKSG